MKNIAIFPPRAAILGWISFSLLLLFFIFKTLKSADYSWDVLAYHLPFAAMAIGLLGADSYSMSTHLSHAYLGFPNFIYYLKGALWWITDTPSAANLTNVFALFIFCVFCFRVLKIRMIWSMCSILAIPILHVALSGGMTDFFANIFLAISMLALFKICAEQAYGQRSLLFWFYAALFLAAGSKPQAVPLAAILLAVLFVFKVHYDFHIRKGFGSTFFLFFCICSLVILHKPILNLIYYRNPIYPMQITLLGYQLPGVFKTNNWSDPQYLANTHQSFRWLLSVFEFDAFSMRPVPYTVDQGDVPLNSRSFRMGGYNGMLVLLSLTFLGMASRNSHYKHSTLLLIFVCLSALLVSVLPGSHELRYYSFWMIFLVTSVLFLFQQTDNTNETIRIMGNLYKGVLVISMIYFMFITGGRYQKVSSISYSDFNRNVLQNVKTKDNSICIFGDESRFSILVAINEILVKNEKVKIYQRQAIEECDQLEFN